MDNTEKNIKEIFIQLDTDTKLNRITWTVYASTYFVGRLKGKKKKGKIVAEIQKITNSYGIIYLSEYGLYWRDSMFKSLENTIMHSFPRITRNHYHQINKPILNSLKDTSIIYSSPIKRCFVTKYKSSDNQNGKQISKNNASVDCENTITTIGMKDFVVRRNVFKCMHKQHHLENVDAEITVTSRIGEDRILPFTAGYCKDCKTYFILESTYEYLKKFGTLNCRLSDEKSYTQTVNSNGMLLAKESILMQYGYTVSKEDDLMEIARHKILANLIDNKIMTKNEIISYLDFFISQHNNTKYQMAVGKWEIDRDFVRDYKLGQYRKYGVGGIRR